MFVDISYVKKNNGNVFLRKIITLATNRITWKMCRVRNFGGLHRLVIGSQHLDFSFINNDSFQYCLFLYLSNTIKPDVVESWPVFYFFQFTLSFFLINLIALNLVYLTTWFPKSSFPDFDFPFSTSLSSFIYFLRSSIPSCIIFILSLVIWKLPLISLKGFICWFSKFLFKYSTNAFGNSSLLTSLFTSTIFHFGQMVECSFTN